MAGIPWRIWIVVCAAIRRGGQAPKCPRFRLICRQVSRPEYRRLPPAATRRGVYAWTRKLCSPAESTDLAAFLAGPRRCSPTRFTIPLHIVSAFVVAGAHGRRHGATQCKPVDSQEAGISHTTRIRALENHNHPHYTPDCIAKCVDRSSCSLHATDPQAWTESSVQDNLA